MTASRNIFLLFLGVLLVGLGIYVAVRSYLGPGPLTGSRFLDVAFAVVFIIRGAMNFRAGFRRRPPTQP